MGTPSFVPADLIVHREAIIGINIEYVSWVVTEIERSFGVPVQQLLGMSVPEYVSSTLHKVCADTPPRGVFYLIHVKGDTAGMCGLRFLHDGVAEIKRMYVRPAYRGRDLGAMAVHKLLVDASNFGYRSVYLDSAPFMTSAQRMYEAHGFVDRAAYEGVEVPASMHATWRFMQRDLSSAAPVMPLRG